jgi:hypothetical protein
MSEAVAEDSKQARQEIAIGLTFGIRHSGSWVPGLPSEGRIDEFLTVEFSWCSNRLAYSFLEDDECLSNRRVKLALEEKVSNGLAELVVNESLSAAPKHEGFLEFRNVTFAYLHDVGCAIPDFLFLEPTHHPSGVTSQGRLASQTLRKKVSEALVPKPEILSVDKEIGWFGSAFELLAEVDRVLLDRSEFALDSRSV